MKRVWLSLSPDRQVEVAYENAVSWSVDEFADVYVEHVFGASRQEAEEWARRQVQVRDTHLDPSRTPAPVADTPVVHTGAWPWTQPLEYEVTDDEERPLVLQALCLWPHDKQKELCTFPDCKCGVTGGDDIYKLGSWTLVERVWPNTLVFQDGGKLLELTVPEEVWNAFT